MDRLESDTTSWPLRIAVLLGAYCLIGGLVSLSGWVFDIQDLTDWSGAGISIQPNAALTVAVTGAALLLLNFGFRVAAAVLGAFVLLIGASSVFQIATEIDLGINTLLMFGREWGRGGVIAPGRMGTPGAVSWTLIGSALVLANWFLPDENHSKRLDARLIAAALAIATLAISGLSVTGYAFGAETLYTLPRFTVIALQTATFILAASVALVFSIQDAGPMRLILDAGPAGTLARRIIPAVIAVPLILGFVRLLGERAGLYDLAFGTAVRSVLEIGLLLGLLWWAAVAVRRQARDAAESGQKAREFDHRLAGVLGSITDSFMTLDKDWRFTYVNDVHLERLGKTREEIIGKNCWEMFPELVGLEVDKQLHRAMADRVPVEYETHYEPWDRWFADRAYPTDDGGLAVYSADVTTRKRAEILAKRHEQELQQLADAMPQVVWIADADGRVRYYNRRVKTFGGIRQDGKHSFDWQPSIHPDDLEATKTAWLNASAEGKPYSHEHRVLMADGTYRWHLSRATRIADGDTHKWFGTATDIHELKEAQSGQRVTQERLQRALDAGQLGIWESDPNTGEIYWDERTREMFGVAPDEKVTYDETIWTRIPKEDQNAVRTAARRALDPDGDGAYVEGHRVRLPDGEIRWLQNTGRVEFTENGDGRRPLLMRGTVADVTERKLAEEDRQFLFAIAEIIRVGRDAVTLLEEVSRALGEYLAVHRCLFNEIDLETDTETVHNDYAREGESVAGRHKISEYSPLASETMSDGRTIVNRDSQNDPRTAEYFDSTYGPAKELAYIAVPMLRNGRWVASLWCSDDKPREWAAREIALVEQIGERSWAAVERLRSETVMRESEERFRHMADDAPVMIWITETDGSCSYLSKSWYDFTGQTPETGLRYGWLEATHPADKENAEKIFLDANANHDPFRIEYRLRRTDGEYRWAIDSARPRFSETGEFLGYIGSVIDITDRKAGEELLRRNHETFFNLVANAPFGIYIVDADFKLVQISAGSRKVFSGIEPLVGRDFAEILRIVWEEPFATEAIEHFRRTLATGEPYRAADTTEQRANLDDTESYDWKIERVVLPDGTFGIVCYFYDLTEQRRIEYALRQSEEKFRTLFESIDEGFVIVEIIFDDYRRPIDYRFVQANPSFSQLTGLPADALGKTARELVPDLEDFWFETYGGVALTGTPTRFEHKSVAMDRWFDVYALRIGGDGSPLVALVFNNITERKRREAHLTFLADVARDFARLTNADDIVKTLGAKLGAHLGVEHCLFAEIDERLDEVVVSNAWRRDPDSRELVGAFKLSDYVTDAFRQAAREGEAIASNDTQNDSRVDGPAYAAYGIGSFVTVPFRRGDEWGYLFTVNDARARRWRDDEIELVKEVTNRLFPRIERARSEAALAESEERFSKAFNASPLVLTISSLETGNLLEVNDTFVEVTGFTRDEAIGKTTLDLGLWSRPADRESELTTVAEDGQIRNTEYIFKMRDGREIVGLLSAERIVIGGEACALTVIHDITERREAIEKLRSSEERFRLATQAVQAVIYDWDVTGDRINRSQELVRLLGFDPEDPQTATNAWWRVQLHPDDAHRAIKAIESAFAERAPRFQDEYRMLHREGHEVWVSDTGLISYDEEGNPVRCVGSVTDITERKRTEAALRESEARFRYTSDSAPVLIWMSDPSGGAIWFNQPWLDFTGRSMDEQIGDRWVDCVHPEDRDRFVNVYATALKARRKFTMEYRLRRPGDEYRWILNQGVPRFAADGEFLGFVGSCIDIHDRREAESALRRSEARLQLAMRIGSFGTWDQSFTDDRMIWSEKMFEIFGIPVTHDRLMSLERFEGAVHPDDAKEVFEASRIARETRQIFSAEYRIIRPDRDEPSWVQAVAQFFYDASGKAVRCVGIAQDITERKRTEEIIRSSEERLRLAQEAGKVGIWDWDAATGATYWSDQMWEFYGEEPRPGGVTNDYWVEHLHPDDRDRVASTVGGILGSDDSIYNDEFRIVRSDGECRWIAVTATVERDAGGTATRMYGVNLDITERKAVAEKIRASEEQLRLITDSIPALVSYIDRDERYRFVNRQYTEWFGLSHDEIIGKSMYEMLGSEAYEALKPRIAAALSGETITFDTWLNYKEAGRKFVHVSYVPEMDAGGAVGGYYALVSDMTEQKRSEDLLRASERRMQMLTESFTDYAIVSTDVDGRVDSWNPGATNIFGYSEDEIIGRSADLLFTPEDVARGVPQQEMQNARKSGRAVDERWHIKKDGTRFFASGVMVPLYVGERLTGYAKIAADLTERKRNAEALQRAYDEMEIRVLDRTRELATANESLLIEINERKSAEKQRISLLQRIVNTQEEERRRIAQDLHDHLGQRLTALRLKLASLRDVCAADEELLARTTRLQQIAELIDSEVSFIAWELRPSALDELGLEDAIETFVKEWSRHYEKRAEFHSTGLGDLRLDSEMETQLYRITQEALNNVVKHADAENVSVLIERTGDNVMLIVEDDGKGFDAERLLASSKKGRGLGLHGMRERAELIGGSLDIESSPGGGTTVYARVLVTGFKRKYANEG